MKIPASITLLSVVLSPALSAADADKILFTDLVSPILEAKCVSCHGEEKSKGKLRLDSFDHTMKGGSEGDTVLPGKASDSGLIFRIVLPLDDDEHMPPEDKPQLTEAEFDALTFWIKSGAKKDAKIGDLKPDEKEMAAIAAAFKDVAKSTAALAADKPEKAAPVAMTEAEQKAVAETIGRVDESGASLMPIAQDTPALRFSALNVQKDFDDKAIEVLAPAATQIQWADLARTQITDAGLKTVGKMKSLTRLHLDGTKVTDAGLDQLAGLQELEYLNLYDTGVTDAGIAKLAKLKNLKKLFLWETKVTETGTKKLSAALPGITINTGWTAASNAAVVAAAAPAKPETKPAPKPAAKPTPKPATPTPAPKPTAKPEPKPTPAPAPKSMPLAGSIEESIATAKKTLAASKTKAATARNAATDAVKKAEAAQKAAESADAEAQKAAEALQLLEKAAAALK